VGSAKRHGQSAKADPSSPALGGIRRDKRAAAKGVVSSCIFQVQKQAEAGAVLSGESRFSGRSRMETMNPALAEQNAIIPGPCMGNS